MKRLDPYLRYIALTSYLPNKDFVKAYDCRFFFVLSGKGELRTEGERFSLSENTLAYYPSGVSYHLCSSDDAPLSFVTVNLDFTRSYPEHTATLCPVRPRDFLPEMERATHKEIGEEHFSSVFVLEHAYAFREDSITLASLFKGGEAYSDELCSTLLKYIILRLAGHLSGDSRENATVRRAAEYIEGNLSTRLDNGTIAAHLGYHPYYLSSLFKRHRGMALHSYVSEARLRHGVDLLLHTDMPIGEIAAECGFNNANHFSTRFKEKYRESPSVWRRLNSII